MRIVVPKIFCNLDLSLVEVGKVALTWSRNEIFLIYKTILVQIEWRIYALIWDWDTEVFFLDFKVLFFATWIPKINERLTSLRLIRALNQRGILLVQKQWITFSYSRTQTEIKSLKLINLLKKLIYWCLTLFNKFVLFWCPWSMWLILVAYLYHFFI